jgi:hypothetical protein
LKKLFKEGLDLEYGCSMRANLSIYLALFIVNGGE